jgi:hypothetical protein
MTEQNTKNPSLNNSGTEFRHEELTPIKSCGPELLPKNQEECVAEDSQLNIFSLPFIFWLIRFFNTILK